MKSVKINSILNVFRMGLTVIVPLITFPYTSRIFFADGTGKLDFCNSYTGVLALIASLGIYTYGIREGTLVRKSRDKLSRLSRELFVVNIFSTTLAYIIFIISLMTISSISKYSSLMLIYSVNIIFTGIGIDWIYGVEEDYMYITIRQIIMQIFQIVSLFIFVHSASDIYSWALISVLCSSLCNFANIIHSKKYIDLFPINILSNIHGVKRHIKPVIILFATQLASRAYTYIDSIVLGFLSTDYAVGIYSAAIKINSILITCILAMYPVFLPRIISFLEMDYIKYRDYTQSVFRLLWALIIPAVTGLIMVSNSVIPIVAGNSFNGAIITMRILAPIILLTSISNGIYSLYFIPQRREKYVLFCTLTAAAINVIATLVLVPFYDENGAAIGSLTAEFGSLCLAVYLLGKSNDIKKCILPNILNYILGSVLILCWCFIVEFFIINIYFQLIISTIGGILVYFLLLKARKDQIYLELSDLINRTIHKIGGICK